MYIYYIRSSLLRRKIPLFGKFLKISKKYEFFIKKCLTIRLLFCIINFALRLQKSNGGVAQLARAFGSYPKCHRFESSRRYHNGPLVKRLRHGPFTAVTRVRFSHGSPLKSADNFSALFLFQNGKCLQFIY